MAKKKHKKRRKQKRDRVADGQCIRFLPQSVFDAEQYLEDTGPNGAHSLVMQALASNTFAVTLPEKLQNLDCLVAAALYDLRCRGHSVSCQSRVHQRARFIADLVIEKQQGWQSNELPTKENPWSDKQNRFLLAYLLSCDMSVRKRINHLKRWLLTEHFGDFLSQTDKSRKRFLRALTEPSAQYAYTMRDSGVAHITATTNLDEDSLHHFFYYGFNDSPVVIVQAMFQFQQSFHPVVIVAAYDEQYLDCGFVTKVMERLSGRAEHLSTTIAILEPVIRIETFVTGNQNFPVIADAVEKHYAPPT